MAALDGQVPLTWVRSSERVPFGNLGDSLSALVVAALSQRAPTHRAFNSKTTRVVGIGTIGQAQRNGNVHFWGTGFDRRRGSVPGSTSFSPDPDTRFTIHAVRGPASRRACLDVGLHAPAVYGDPGWFMPRILPMTRAPRHELGVVLHISELAEPSPDARPRDELLRYESGIGDGVHFISTYHAPTTAGLFAKMQEFPDCKRIVSTSFHGLVLADAYRIPCAFLSPAAGGELAAQLGLNSEGIDHRVADFYSAAPQRRLPVYQQPRHLRTDWASVIATIDRVWEPLDYPADRLLDAFPIEPGTDLEAPAWPLPRAMGEDFRW